MLGEKSSTSHRFALYQVILLTGLNIRVNMKFIVKLTVRFEGSDFY